MADLYEVPTIIVPKHYPDYFPDFSKQLEKLETSSTVYVGNLSFYTEQYQIYEVFSKVGLIKELHLGLNKKTNTPAGFCFVVYIYKLIVMKNRFYDHETAMTAVNCLNNSKIDERVIRVEIDWGYSDGRQWGRAVNGAQIRDFRRKRIDEDRDISDLRVNKRGRYDNNNNYSDYNRKRYRR